MKKFCCIIGIAIMLFSSCNNEASLTDETREVATDAQKTEILSFADEITFNRSVKLLSELDKNQRNEWIKANFGGFRSLYDIYTQAIEEAETLDESMQAYMSYKEKYRDYLYFPEYKEDYGVYLPVSDANVAMLLNKDGFVVIGGKTKNMRDITNYAQLQQTGKAMYAPEDEVRTRASNIGEEYDSGWFNYQNKKKIRLKCGRQITDIDPSVSGAITYRLHFEISFRKKTWLGWTNYSSCVNMNGFYQIGNVVNISESKTADSSHDYYYGPNYAPVTMITDGTHNYKGYVMPQVHVEVNLQYRGIPDEYMPDYNFTLSELAFPV